MRSLIIVIALFFGIVTAAHAQDSGIDRALDGVQNLHDTVRDVVDAVEGKDTGSADEYRRIYPNSYDGKYNRGYHYGEIKPGVPPGHQKCKCKHKNKKGKGHNKHCKVEHHHDGDHDHDHHDDRHDHDDHHENHQGTSRWYKPWSWNDDVKNRHED